MKKVKIVLIILLISEIIFLVYKNNTKTTKPKVPSKENTIINTKLLTKIKSIYGALLTILLMILNY